MLPILRELFQHQAWADAALLRAVREYPEAWNDEKLRSTLHHMVLVQRAFLALFEGRPFDFQQEAKILETLEDMERIYRNTHDQEFAFLGQVDDAALHQVKDMPWIPGCRPSLVEMLLQVVMHSQNHRGQCLTRLRSLGATPPTLDFILWVKDRPAAWATA